MTSFLPRSVALLLFFYALAPFSVSAAQTTPQAVAPSTQIPAVNANTLAGDPVHLPTDLHGKAAILVLGFGKGARGQIRDWGKRLADTYVSSPTILFYEMPVVASVPRFLRGLVMKQIASELPEPSKHHFIPISDSESHWRALAQVKDPDRAYILVVDGAGTVQWSTSGALTDAAFADVRAHIPATHK